MFINRVNCFSSVALGKLQTRGTRGNNPLSLLLPSFRLRSLLPCFGYLPRVAPKAKSPFPLSSRRSLPLSIGGKSSNRCSPYFGSNSVKGRSQWGTRGIVLVSTMLANSMTNLSKLPVSLGLLLSSWGQYSFSCFKYFIVRKSLEILAFIGKEAQSLSVRCREIHLQSVGSVYFVRHFIRTENLG